MQLVWCFKCAHVFAGIIEQVGWTNGSMHNKIIQQPWHVRTMADVALALFILMAGISLSLFAGVHWLWGQMAKSKNALKLKKMS